MKPIAILGGAFDPVTLGHLWLMEVVEKLGFEVVCMPCGDRHFFGKRMRPAPERLEMLRLAVGARQLCDTETEHNTYRAADTYPLHLARYGRVHWIIGSDNANCLERWHEGERLKGIIPFIVVARQGMTLTENGRWCLKAPHHFVTDMQGSEISSTIARAAIAQGDWVKAASVVPEKVLRLIQERGWYSAQTIAPTGPR